MEIVTLYTGLFEDGDIVKDAANAPVIDLRKCQSKEDWDEVIDRILDADLIVTA